MQKNCDLLTIHAVKNPPATMHGADRILKVTWGQCQHGTEQEVRNLGETSGGATGKHLKITCEDLWELQRILDGKKVDLRKTYKTQTEVNDKVWALNREPERALETLAIFYVRFGQVTKDLGEVDRTP